MTNGTLPEPGADTGTPAPPRAMQGAVADRITEGDVDLERATSLLVGITWRGLKGVGTDT